MELESIFTRLSSYSSYAALASLLEWLANTSLGQLRDDIFAQFIWTKSANEPGEHQILAHLRLPIDHARCRHGQDMMDLIKSPFPLPIERLRAWLRRCFLEMVYAFAYLISSEMLCVTHKDGKYPGDSMEQLTQSQISSLAPNLGCCDRPSAKYPCQYSPPFQAQKLTRDLSPCIAHSCHSNNCLPKGVSLKNGWITNSNLIPASANATEFSVRLHRSISAGYPR